MNERMIELLIADVRYYMDKYDCSIDEAVADYDKEIPAEYWQEVWRRLREKEHAE